jgi:hypothetical protein
MADNTIYVWVDLDNTIDRAFKTLEASELYQKRDGQ